MFNATALNAYTKRTYVQKKIENSMTSVEDVTVRKLKRDTDGSGENVSWLADVDDAFNGSALFATAQAGAVANNAVVGSRFQSDWYDYSAVAQISESVIGKTRNNDGAWMKAVDVAYAKTMKSIAHAFAVFLQGKGWGEVGGAIDTVSGSTFKPSVRSDISKFVKGMPLHFSSALSTAGLRSSTAVYVTAVSYTVGAELVTVSATMASVSAVNGDFPFIAGCREDSATPTRRVWPGLDSWLPNQNIAIPATDSTLLTVVRTSNSRLYGTFVDGTGGGSILGSLIDGCQEAITMGNAKTLELFCSKANFAAVAKDLQTAVEYKDNPASKSVGTNKLLVFSNGDGGDATLQISRTTNDSQIWGYDPAQVILKSIGGAPHISSDDGLTMCRLAADNGYETRWFSQSVLEVPNPASMLRVQLV